MLGVEPTVRSSLVNSFAILDGRPRRRDNVTDGTVMARTRRVRRCDRRTRRALTIDRPSAPAFEPRGSDFDGAPAPTGKEARLSTTTANGAEETPPD